MTGLVLYPLCLTRAAAVIAAAAVAIGATAAEAQTRAPGASSVTITEHGLAAPEAPGSTRIDLAVEMTATTATGARSATELAVRRVVAALSGSGIPVQEIRTQASFLIPEYEPGGVVAVTTIRNDRRITGYRAVTGITVHAADARHVGLLVDLAHGAGANRVLGVWVADSASPLGN